MRKELRMSAHHQFACGAVSKEQAVLDAERMVKVAAEPVIPGELVKGQIRNASNALQLDFGTVRRAWYRLSGPEIYPTIYNSWAALIERRSAELQRQGSSPWHGNVHLRGVWPERNPHGSVRETRSVTRAPPEILPCMSEGSRPGSSAGEIQSDAKDQSLVPRAKRNRRASVA